MFEAITAWADLALKLTDDFDSDANKARRSRVSSAFINGLKLSETDDLFDFFEQIGLLFEGA
jgi:hypothetical protein